MREDLEDAYNTTRRLRLRLSALAKLSTEHAQQPNRATSLALEATVALDVCACVLHQFSTDQKPEVLALHKAEQIDEVKLKLAATRLAVDVSTRREAVALTNLSAHYDGGSWLEGAGIYSYLGVPLFDARKQLIGVAGVFGCANREFNEEDEWWLSAASQSVADSLAYAQIERKLHELERALMGQPEHWSGEISEMQSATSRLSILVVDDHRDVNDVLCEYLSLEGYSVESAFDGLEAMRRFRPAEHDVVITDVAMPLMNGWELIAALHVRAPELPVLLMTGYGSGNWNESYLKKQGVCAVLSKPLDLANLSKILEEIRAGRR